MTGEYFCRPRENLHCFYITNENIYDFVMNYGFNGEYTITTDKNFAYVKYESMTWHIRLNVFMVYKDGNWMSYTKRAFEESYEIVI